MAFPTQPILDNFNRVDGALGANWTVEAAGPQILSNQVDRPSTGTWAWWNTQYARPLEAYFTLPVLELSSAYLVFCWNSQTFGSNNGYRLNMVAAANQMILSRFDAGGETTLAGSGLSAFVPGDTFGVFARADAIEVWRQTGGVWAKVMADQADTAYMSGYVGFGLTDSTVRLDDFGGGNVVTAIAPPGLLTAAGGGIF